MRTPSRGRFRPIAAKSAADARLPGFRSSTEAALSTAEAKAGAILPMITNSIHTGEDMVAEAGAECQRAHYMLEQKKAEVQQALKQLMGEDEG